MRLVLLSLFFVLTTSASAGRALDPTKTVSRIAFGSCARHDGREEPIWETIRGVQPDVLLLIGDNIYGDTDDMEVMRSKYEALAAQPGFATLRSEVPILATWDDHDYGLNDGGAEFTKKEDSKTVFLNFFEEPLDSPRRAHAGIYTSTIVGPPGQRVQIVLLDTRTFRTPLTKKWFHWATWFRTGGKYRPSTDPGQTILGDAQWAWLDAELAKPADLRVIASSIQVISDQHGFETWGNMPKEREKLLALLDRPGTGPVVLVSGDRHTAEISALKRADGSPLYDVTASPLANKARVPAAPNPHQVGAAVSEINFGEIDVDWERKSVYLHIKTVTGKPALTRTLPLK